MRVDLGVDDKNMSDFMDNCLNFDAGMITKKWRKLEQRQNAGGLRQSSRG